MPTDETDRTAAPLADPGDVDDFDDGLEDDASWDEQPDGGRERTVRAIVAAIVLVIIVILVLLLLRQCSSADVAGSVGDKEIVTVPPQVRVENVVSVWIDPDIPLRQVLAKAAVRATSTRSMGDGMYFVFLADGVNATAAVARLKSDPRVHDAGFAYNDTVGQPIKASP